MSDEKFYALIAGVVLVVALICMTASEIAQAGY